jgi:hypothetical protein
VGSEFPVFVWWNMDQKTLEADSKVMLSSLELMRYAQSTVKIASLLIMRILTANVLLDFSGFLKRRWGMLV